MRSERTDGGVSRIAVAGALGYWVLILVVLPATLAHAADRLRPRLYDVSTETVMPHLEENLRYAITREQRCLGEAQLSTAFPILSHPALAGCSLVHASRSEGGVTYELVCQGGQGTTGDASWELDDRRLAGTLQVRLGGKNMTFYQRVTATLRGECSPTT